MVSRCMSAHFSHLKLVVRSISKLWPINIIIFFFCQLPLYLYLLRDLYNKLDISLEQPTRKLAPWIVAAPIPKVPSGLGSLVATDVLKRLQTVFPSLKRHLNSAISQLRQGKILVFWDKSSVDLLPWSLFSSARLRLVFRRAPLNVRDIKSGITLDLKQFWRLVGDCWREQRKNMQLSKNTGWYSPRLQAIR